MITLFWRRKVHERKKKKIGKKKIKIDNLSGDFLMIKFDQARPQCSETCSNKVTYT
jgi:hypothetical protein